MGTTDITGLTLERFTAFRNVTLDFSEGINIIVGANATGKTHILKVLYSACDITRTTENFGKKLIKVFSPVGLEFKRLKNREVSQSDFTIKVLRGDMTLVFSYSESDNVYEVKFSENEAGWNERPGKCVYIPAKEMLVNAPWLRAVYDAREIELEEVYVDILRRAEVPMKREEGDFGRNILGKLHNEIGGTIEYESKNKTYFLHDKYGSLEFPILAEGWRKLGLLSVLIRNGELCEGAKLFWDEPETNLNPSMMGFLIEIILELQRNGVQIFIATHSYELLKYLDLRMQSEDRVRFIDLARNDSTNNIDYRSGDRYLDVFPNRISEAQTEIYNETVSKSIGSHPNDID